MNSHCIHVYNYDNSFQIYFVQPVSFFKQVVQQLESARQALTCFHVWVPCSPSLAYYMYISDHVEVFFSKAKAGVCTLCKTAPDQFLNINLQLKKILKMYLPLTKRVPGSYCKLWPAFPPLIHSPNAKCVGHKSKAEKTRICNLQYRPRRRG